MLKSKMLLKLAILLLLSLNFAACSSVLKNVKIFVTQEDGLVRSQEHEVISCFDEAYNNHFCFNQDDFSKVVNKLRQCKQKGQSSIDLTKVKIYVTMKDIGLVRQQEGIEISCKSQEYEGYLCVSGQDLENFLKVLRNCKG